MDLVNYNKFVNEFTENHNKTIDEMESQNNSLTVLERTKEELSYFKKYIFDFFSSNGSSKEIHEIYESVLSRDHVWKTINTCDMNRSRDLYENYSNGMKKYLNEIISLESASDETTVATLEKARNGDELFVNSLFGGYNNSREETNICEAVKNIECLIDFIPSIDSFNESVDEFIKSVSKKNDDKLSLECSKLYSESVTNYCYNTIKNIINDFNSIHDSISLSYNKSTGNDEFTLF